MGARGPVGKRSDKRLGHGAQTRTSVTKVGGAAEVEVPRPDRGWHPVAKRWYAALAGSGQAEFYEPSDWALAYLMAESISRDLKPQFVGFRQVGRQETTAEFAVVPLKGASLSAYLKAMTDLLVTEGARRRAGIELQRPQAAEPAPDNVIDYRARAAARS